MAIETASFIRTANAPLAKFPGTRSQPSRTDAYQTPEYLAPKSLEPAFAESMEPNNTNSALDRRLHKRVHIILLGRFMRANKMEYPCKLHDISVGGAAIKAPVTVDQGERIVAHFDQLGVLEGEVSRVFDDGYAIQLIATRHKREKIAAQLTWLINRKELQLADQRRHERIVPTNDISTLKVGEGLVIQVHIIDVSMSGASIGTDARPPIGHAVILGKLRAKVMRHHDNGIGVQFTDTQDLKTVSQHFV